MKKLESYKDFQVGRIYNRVYTGPDLAYAEVNGKETFIVIEVDPVLRVIMLFAESGNPFSDQFKYGPIIFSRPDYAFQEFEIFEPDDKSEWFIKSTKVTSLAQALEANLILLDEIKNQEMNSSRFVPCFGADMKMKGVYLHFSVEGTQQNPLLQSVFVVWGNWQEAEVDFAQYGSKIM